MTERIWKAVSALFSVPVVGTLVGVLLTNTAYGWPALQVPLTLFMLFYVVAPVGIVAAMYRQGRVREFEIPYRPQRTRPLLFTAAASVLGLLTFIGMGMDWLLIGFGVGHLLVVGALYLITGRWKISIHGALMGVWMGVMTVVAALEMLFLLPLVVLIGVARVRLREHTPKQYVVGFFLGLLGMTLPLIGIALLVVTGG